MSSEYFSLDLSPADFVAMADRGALAKFMKIAAKHRAKGVPPPAEERAAARGFLGMQIVCAYSAVPMLRWVLIATQKMHHAAYSMTLTGIRVEPQFAEYTDRASAAAATDSPSPAAGKLSVALSPRSRTAASRARAAASSVGNVEPM